MKNKIDSNHFAMVGSSDVSFLRIAGRGSADSKLYWRWGDDNLFPNALALMSRRSTTHRRIINDKADYISGKGFSFDENVSVLAQIVECANDEGETLRQVLNKVAFDKALFGNAFVEIVTDESRSFFSLYHQDASRCRRHKDNEQVVLHHDWVKFSEKEARMLPAYPKFEADENGFLRSIIHFKDYEPMFEHYGVPPYIAGMNVSAIAYKTDCWNISRLDNSFQLSGVMMLDATTESDEEAANIIRAAEKRFAGNPGQIMFIMKDASEGDSSKFIPIASSSEGDWTALHDQATADIVVAHSWFRSLSGLDYGAGFSAERILYEYEVALNTVIVAEQEEMLEPIRDAIKQMMGVEASSLQIINRPPAKSRPAYMKVWEARKADGLEFDLNDEMQQMYISQLSNSSKG